MPAQWTVCVVAQPWPFEQVSRDGQTRQSCCAQVCKQRRCTWSRLATSRQSTSAAHNTPSRNSSANFASERARWICGVWVDCFWVGCVMASPYLVKISLFSLVKRNTYWCWPCWMVISFWPANNAWLSILRIGFSALLCGKVFTG